MGPPTRPSGSRNTHSPSKPPEGTHMRWKTTCPSACHHQPQHGPWDFPHGQFAHGLSCAGSLLTTSVPHACVLVVIKCTYLPPAYLYFIPDKEDKCLLLTSSTSFVDLPFYEHRMMEKHHMDQNPYTS
jgi:hypothetical protein